LNKKKSILIIEDEKFILDCYREAIEKLNFFDFIVTASSIKEAVVKMKNQRFDYCLTDLHLDKESIISIFEKELASNVVPKNITVVSAFFDKESVCFFIKNKVKNILTKPLTEERIESHFKGLIKHEKHFLF
jgi:response regulator of citrate/malate metabolism